MEPIGTAVAHEAVHLATKIKALEAAYAQALPSCRPYVVRLDGVAFKNFTSGMEKPFDPRFTRAMILTARDLLDRSGARTAFCQSDEITLVFGAEDVSNEMLYGGRVTKIQSVLASMAGVRFNHHISRITKWPNELVAKKVSDGGAFFDARVISVPDAITAMESVYWRHKFDLRRNAVNAIGCSVLGHEAMAGAPMKSVLKALLEQHNLDPFAAFPKAAVWGVFLKKEEFAGTGYNPLKKIEVPCVRHRVIGRTFDWEGTEAERTEMIMSKLWRSSHPCSVELIDI